MTSPEGGFMDRMRASWDARERPVQPRHQRVPSSPGWYQDPERPGLGFEFYWDGSGWWRRFSAPRHDETAPARPLVWGRTGAGAGVRLTGASVLGDLPPD